MDLVTFIGEQCRSLVHSGKFEVRGHVEGEQFLKSISYELSLSACRIIQEQISNIIKHAKAPQLTFFLIGSKNSLDIEIKDNGAGFLKNPDSKGLGLRNIYNRAEMFQGSVYINSAADEGCLLSLCFPIQPSPKSPSASI